jgi:hypothetical protein
MVRIRFPPPASQLRTRLPLPARGFASDSSIAAMRLAMPDMDLLTFPEMADAIETVIAAAPNVLWLADGDTGYGNALALQKTTFTLDRVADAPISYRRVSFPTESLLEPGKIALEILCS